MTPSRLEAVLAAIDSENQQDPNLVDYKGSPIAKELLYGQRMSERLNIFAPDAGELLQIASRAQHIKRWSLARKDFPMDKVGYKTWRTELAKFHANTTADLMATAGYSADEQARVGELLQKKQLKRDLEVQTLEDVICLVFLEHHLEDFATKHDEPKLIDIIQKTWRKMSENGHSAALALPLPESLLALVGKALA
jgi:hypothetical protein